MIKRTLYFGSPSYLSLTNAQLTLRLPEVEKNETLPDHYKKEVSASIPVEDIGIVVLDHKQITITQALMEALLENNTALITCDATHHPTGLMLPLCGNTIQNERFRSQLDATEPLKKQLWAQTISQKIKNQAAMFDYKQLDDGFLSVQYRNVKSGDPDNREATAAAHYWGNIFKQLPAVNEFKRFREGLPPNNYLNYGYALLRATMARSIVGAGLLPTLGIFHHNRYNAYCLADDLMEPYRPYVDKVVYELIEEKGITEELSKEIKALLLKIPAMDVLIDGEKSPLMNATQRTAVSLVKCFSGEQRRLLYPEFM
ncbi:MAG: cas1 [Bacteroidetes bacterium]|nr:cas1 [Bacteroidota bacterium]